MSGVNPQIPLSFRPTPNIGPNFGAAISDASNLMQLQQAGQEAQRQNALRNILGAPGAFDKMGQPTPETTSKVMGIDPNAGLKLQQNALTGLNQRATLAISQGKREEQIQELIEPVRVASMDAYQKATGDESAKRAAAQKVYTEELGRLTNGGSFSDEEKTRLNPQFDPVRVGAMSSRWQQLQEQKRKDTQTEKHQTTQEQIERERNERMATHDEQTNRRAGATIGADVDGKTIFFYPNESPEKRMQYQDGTPVPSEKQSGARKMAAGTGAAKDADNAAIEADILKEHPDWTPGAAKLERIRKTKEAGFKPEDPSKGWEILTDPTTNEQYQHHKGTGESKTLTGEVYVPGGAQKLGGPRSAKDTDHLAIEEDIRRENPDWTPGKIATETQKREAAAKLLPGSIAANREAIAADVESDPAFQGKSAGEKARETENRFQVARTATMTPEVAENIARQYVATGNPNVLAGFRRSPQMMNSIEKAIIHQQELQGKSPEEVARQSANFAAFTQGVKAFEAGGKLEQPVRSQNVAVQHLGVLQNAADQLHNGTFTPTNAVGQAIARWTGSPAPTDFSGVKRIVGAELVKAILGTGGALGDRDALDADLKETNSPRQLNSLINRYKQLMAGQLSGLRKTYDRLETGKSFDKEFLFPETVETISRFERQSSQGAATPTEGLWKQGMPIPPGAVEHLRSDPASAATFDKHFGAGEAAKILEAKPPAAAKPTESKPAGKAAANPNDLPDGSIVSQGGTRYRKQGGNWIAIE